MKTLNEVFTDQEFADMQEVKKRAKQNWHDFILSAVGTYDAEWNWSWSWKEEEVKPK